jgi:hypothetical protein
MYAVSGTPVILSRPTMTNAPYAGPAATDPSVDFATGSQHVVSPYVPPEWRARASVVVRERESDSTASAAIPETESLPSIGSFLQASTEVAPPREDWPFQDAGEQTTELTEELLGNEVASGSSGAGVQPLSLPMWKDDDLMDIMPPPSTRTPTSGTTERTSAESTTSADGIQHTESAARALETLAQRVRSGDLLLPGYAPELGDAAALAAALAALLGIRR